MHFPTSVFVHMNHFDGAKSFCDWQLVSVQPLVQLVLIAFSSGTSSWPQNNTAGRYSGGSKYVYACLMVRVRPCLSVILSGKLH